MRRRTAIAAAIALFFLMAPPGAAAQQAGKVYRIGWLSASAINATFRRAMSELGYVEGRNLVFVYRQAKQRKEYTSLARELAAGKPDLILAVGVSAVRAAKQATSTIPIVMGNSSADPVRQGLISSLAKPGGNVTGVFDLLPDLAGKRVELLRELFPKLSRIAHIAPEGPVTRAHLERVREVAGRLGVTVQALTVERPDRLESAFQAASAAGADAAVVVGVSFFIPRQLAVLKLAAKYRVPAIYTHRHWVRQGGLLAYTTDSHARYRRAAWYVDRILKGAKPGDLPVEQPKEFLLEVNLKTAKTLGVVIPGSVLIRADKVIE